MLRHGRHCYGRCPVANAYGYSAANRHANSYAKANRHANSYGKTNRHANSYAKANRHGDAATNPLADRYATAYTNSHANPDPNTYAC